MDAENLTCLLVRSFEEASLGLTALLLGQGDPTSIACTFSLFAEGFQEYACSTEEDDLVLAITLSPYHPITLCLF
jgi:hypothetical protein